MKIALPLLNEKELAIDFSHSEFIGIYDLDENVVEVLENKTIAQKLTTMDLLKDLSNSGLAYTISPFYSYLTLRVLKEIRIETYKAKGKSLAENIEFFRNNSLIPFQADESLLYGECVSDCTSCSTTSCSN